MMLSDNWLLFGIYYKSLISERQRFHFGSHDRCCRLLIGQTCLVSTVFTGGERLGSLQGYYKLMIIHRRLTSEHTFQ